MSPDSDDLLLQKHAEMCKMFSNEKRLKILEVLRDEEKCVSDVCDETGYPQPTVSSHLNKLKSHGVVQSTREGLNTYYSITDERIYEAMDLVREAMMDRLEHEMESKQQV